MKPEEFPRHRGDIAPFLSADFPHRVLERVHTIERRRAIRRRVTITALPIAAVVAIAMFALPSLRGDRSQQIALKSRSSYTIASAQYPSWDSSIAQWNDDPDAADDTVTGVMFPDVKTVADFDSSYQSDSWRFYNPSWPQDSE